ncbi:VCBS repeat-containing protein [Ruminiclostridium herbifermentans]|uniref:VCBS repeat-containing protein n=1 Tax=Ruminiclostridium herbifermentans TaxID=2488810 RepID=A0A4U7JFJ0_9FIRM|nr:VCBS repeat-containing protein [Ruminiclostridium herbifermentans]QNU67465.1 VCBS repeat-containing protein [Ruminiclostridium herbifermentans]
MYNINSFGKYSNNINNVISFAIGDVNGDGIPDYVYLTGNKIQDSSFIQDITLNIKDGKTGLIQNFKLASNSGYSPAIILEDFTGDKVKDIFVSIASGGSGGIMFYYIFTDINNQIRMIFDYEIYNNKYSYKIEYENYYKVSVMNIELQTNYIIDITYKGKDYLNDIYMPNGELKSPIEGWVDPLSGLYPVDFDGNGIYELLGYQRISGQYHADSLGYVQSVLKWNGRKFYLMDQYVAIFGAEVDEKG